MQATDSRDTWRIFVAVGLPATIRERLIIHVSRLRQSVPQARASWSRPENIHLTLKFLGDIPQSRTRQLSAAASCAVENFEPFRIALGGTGAFATRGAPKVLWIGLTDLDGKLGELHARLEAACALASFENEPRPFHPHLTLARLRKSAAAHALAAAHKQMSFEPEEFAVSEVLVIRSEPSSAGSKYTIISRHPLTTPGRRS